MLEILGEKIHDSRFLGLLRNMLRAGYLEDWEWNETLSGAPQGGVVSPILSNIWLYCHECGWPPVWYGSSSVTGPQARRTRARAAWALWKP
jgi:hypothetical protein